MLQDISINLNNIKITAPYWLNINVKKCRVLSGWVESSPWAWKYRYQGAFFVIKINIFLKKCRSAFGFEFSKISGSGSEFRSLILINVVDWFFCKFFIQILVGSRQGPLQLWNIKSVKLVYTFKGISVRSIGFCYSESNWHVPYSTNKILDVF